MNPEFFRTNPTSGRDLVFSKAKTEHADALECARLIAKPWFRAQALAAVARYAADEKVEAVAKEALNAASEQADPYKVVAVSAWPVRALIECRREQTVEKLMPQLLALSDRIDHPVSRLEALFLLWQAVYPLGGEMRRQVQDKFVAACQAANSWKAGDRLAWAATILVSDDPEEALELVAVLREGRVKRQALRRIKSGRSESARVFFW